MKKIAILLIMLSGLFVLGNGKLNGKVNGKVKVVTTYPYIRDIVHQVGGKEVSIISLARGFRDPHYITPRPSFIAKLRKADLLVINGGQLEIGWLPPVIRQANNQEIGKGRDGLLSLIDFVVPLDVPVETSRAGGDVHPEGNPHFQLDPHNIPLLAKAVADRLCKLDPRHCADYKNNFEIFNGKWMVKLRQWEKMMNALKGKKVVQYHKSFNYLTQRYGIESSATLEPLPGIPPTTRHISKTIDIIKKNHIQLVLQDVYHSSKTAKFVCSRSSARMVIIPHDVEAVKGVEDIFSLFDEIVRRLTSL